MSKKSRKSKKSILLGIIFVLCLALGPFSSFDKGVRCKAEDYTPGEDSTYDSYPYTLDAYLVEIRVNEDNTLNITEKIKANFKQPRHGIYRKIPLKNEVIRADGSKSTVRAKVSNVMVADVPFEEYKENGYWFIKAGDPAFVLTGTKVYTIQYTYKLGKDPLKDKDEFYFNIIGPEWDAPIGNIGFKITMPKDFDASALGFSSGVKGSVGSEHVVYEADGRTIAGAYEGILDPGEALTVRCELPEGYFTGGSSTWDFPGWIYIVFILPVVFVVIAGILWHKYGRDDKVVETVEFYPPEGFNSMEVGFLYKGSVDDMDVLSLLIELANKGYIALEEIEETGLFKKKKSFKITKIREYDGNNINEKLFFQGLFAPKMAAMSFKDMLAGQPPRYEESMNTVTASDLQYRFYKTISQIKSNVNSSENKDKIFESGLNGKRAIIILMIVFAFIGITIPPLMDMEQMIFLMIFAVVFPGIGFAVLMSMVFSGPQTIYVNGKPKKSSWGTKLFGLIWGGIFGGAPWVFLVLPNLLDEPFYFIGYMLGIACITGMFFFNKFMPKRTPYGNQMLGKIMGFKNYLETAEKARLETMVAQDPEYFYRILPYTYVLGVSDKWISKFETILIQRPDWYYSPVGDSFSPAAFGDFMNQTMSTAQSTMASSPSDGGSGGGGGSSGGGSGGGGGGSW